MKLVSRTARALAAVALLGCSDDAASKASPASLRVRDVLGGGSEGYAEARAPRPFVFPADHGPHPDFRSEWWYVTGNLEAADGRRFGYHLTFFRNAVAPEPAEPTTGPASRWRTRQVWMAHFAIADIAARREHASERFARGALGLAGATAAPFAVHLGAWSLRSRDAGTFAPLTLSAGDGDIGLDLELTPTKPIVLQGEAGLSRKSAREGNASYYYSIPRLAAQGSIRIGDTTVAVTGTGWLDREWSTSALDAGQVGWDWFALQLDDDRELMFYRMRRADGGADPTSSGIVVERDGSSRAIGLDDVELTVTRTWRSPRSGATYPVDWRLAIPAMDIDLDVSAAFDDQELDLSVRYWEGAVDVRGRTGTIRGRGYLEMTGYDDVPR